MSDGQRRNVLLGIHGTMRAEILQRVAWQNRLVAGAWTCGAVGALLACWHAPLLSSAAVVVAASAVVAALQWTHSDLRVQQLGRYLRDLVEPGLDEIEGWEAFHERVRPRGRLGSFWQASSRGVLLATPWLVPLAARVASLRQGAVIWLPALLAGAATLWIVWPRPLVVTSSPASAPPPAGGRAGGRPG